MFWNTTYNNPHLQLIVEGDTAVEVCIFQNPKEKLQATALLALARTLHHGPIARKQKSNKRTNSCFKTIGYAINVNSAYEILNLTEFSRYMVQEIGSN